MSGRVLEFKGEREYNEGKIEMLVYLVSVGQLNATFAIKQAKKYRISDEEFKEMLNSYHPDDEQLQG